MTSQKEKRNKKNEICFSVLEENDKIYITYPRRGSYSDEDALIEFLGNKQFRIIVLRIFDYRFCKSLYKWIETQKSIEKLTFLHKPHFRSDDYLQDEEDKRKINDKSDEWYFDCVHQCAVNDWCFDRDHYYAQPKGFDKLMIALIRIKELPDTLLSVCFSELNFGISDYMIVMFLRHCKSLKKVSFVEPCPYNGMWSDDAIPNALATLDNLEHIVLIKMYTKQSFDSKLFDALSKMQKFEISDSLRR